MVPKNRSTTPLVCGLLTRVPQKHGPLSVSASLPGLVGVTVAALLPDPVPLLETGRHRGQSRPFSTVAEVTPCRLAASAGDNLPFNTASTTCICSSADT